MYLVPWTEYPSWEHEQVTHGDQTGPYKKGEEAEHPLEDRFYADEDEDGKEEEKSSRHRDEECQVVLRFLDREGYREYYKGWRTAVNPCLHNQ